ncbi:MAG: VOC family protein, partial [Ilumatobacteraceae bacterium]
MPPHHLAGPVVRPPRSRSHVVGYRDDVKPKVSLITLGVADLEVSRAFYTALGFECPNYDPDAGIVFFELDNGGQNGPWLALFPRQDLAHDATVADQIDPGSVAVLFRGVALAHNEPSRADVDRVFAEAVAIDARVVKVPEPTEWGGYSGYFADPDGHLWEVAHNPFSDLT